jgi:hypothetical protein
VSEIKIYEAGCWFVAAKNVRDAVRCVHDLSHMSVRDCLEEIKVLTDKDLEEYVFSDGDPDCSKTPTRSFKEQLEKLKTDGERFPQVFAASEY